MPEVSPRRVICSSSSWEKGTLCCLVWFLLGGDPCPLVHFMIWRCSITSLVVMLQWHLLANMLSGWDVDPCLSVLTSIINLNKAGNTVENWGQIILGGCLVQCSLCTNNPLDASNTPTNCDNQKYPQTFAKCPLRRRSPQRSTPVAGEWKCTTVLCGFWGRWGACRSEQKWVLLSPSSQPSDKGRPSTSK